MIDQKADLWLVIMAEMERRRQRGWETYQQPLTAEDDRNWCEEAIAEALDMAAYLKAASVRFDFYELRIRELEDSLATANERIRQLESR